MNTKTKNLICILILIIVQTTLTLGNTSKNLGKSVTNSKSATKADNSKAKTVNSVKAAEKVTKVATNDKEAAKKVSKLSKKDKFLIHVGVGSNGVSGHVGGSLGGHIGGSLGGSIGTGNHSLHIGVGHHGNHGVHVHFGHHGHHGHHGLHLNFGYHGHHHHHHHRRHCRGKRWSYKVAHGQKAPWTYAGGQVVHWKGRRYRALWGGTETPGTHICRTRAACAHNGWQWQLLGRCRRHRHHYHGQHWNHHWNHHGHRWNHHGWNHHHRRHCRGQRWSYKVAHGQKAPWTYAGGQEVHWKGRRYRALWGGTETPGTHICRDRAACANNGWQWQLLGRCGRHHHHHHREEY